MKSVLITIAKLLITVLFFYYIFTRIDSSQFTETLRAANMTLLIAAFLLLWLGHFICIFRWRLLMRPLMPTPTIANLFGIYCIGMFFNLTFPTIIGGDVVKVYYAGKQSKAWAESFASTFLDRDAGMFAMMIIACSATLIHPVSVPGIPVALILWSIFFLFVFGNIAIFTPRFYRLLSTLLQKLRLAKIAAKMDNIARAFQIVGKHPGTLWAALGISFMNQLLVIATTWVAALGLGVHISPFYYLIFVPVITLISMIPISLNGMGLREFSFMSLFGAIGVSHESCIALGLLASLMTILSSLPGGIVYILFRNRNDRKQMAAIGTELQ